MISALVSRANFICVDGNSTIAATPLFVVEIKLQNANANTGINLDGAPIIFRTVNTAVTNCYAEVFLYYSTVVQVLPNAQFRVSQ